MAIIKRIAWNILSNMNNQLIDVVYFPASFDEKSIKRQLILYYGYTGNFRVEQKQAIGLI